MGDVAQILSGSIPQNDTTKNPEAPSASNKKSNSMPTAIPPLPASHIQPKSLQSASLSRPVLKLLSGDHHQSTNIGNEELSTPLPPIVPAATASSITNISTTGGSGGNTKNKSANKNTTSGPKNQQQHLVKINNKFIDSSKKTRSWVWAPFSSSARTDGFLLNHWVRAGVEYPDYPYARFDVHLNKLTYRESNDEGEEFNSNNTNSGTSPSNKDNINNNTATAKQSEEEKDNATYKQFLQDPNWTQSETDALLHLCYIHELRWPIIADRWMTQFGMNSGSGGKKVEDLQHRYYTIGMILNRRRVEKAAKIEAENLAKALAMAQSSGGGTAGGNRSMLMPLHQQSSAITPGSTETESPPVSKEQLVAEHALASATATSSSSAISTIVGNVQTSIQPPIEIPQTGTSNQPVFDLEAERQRREILEIIWNRSKDDESEEADLLKELKMIDTQIRKLKKSGGHILAAAAAAGSTGVPPSSMGMGGNANTIVIGSTGGSDGTTPVSSRGSSPVPITSSTSFARTATAGSGAVVDSATAGGAGSTANDSSFAMLDTQFASTAPTPTPGTPYLQSGRLTQPATGGHLGINKTTLKRMEQVLKELDVMERPIPTKRVCDLYDHVRKGVLTLLTLQKVMLKKESEVVSRRVKLEKVAGSAVAKEIANQQAAAAQAAAAAAAAAQAAAAAAASAPAPSSSNATSSTSTAAAATTTTTKGKGGGSSNSSKSGTSKKTGGGKGKGTKRKSGDGTKSGTKRKASSKKGGNSGGKGAKKDNSSNSGDTAAKSGSAAGGSTGASSTGQATKGNSKGDTGGSSDAKPAKKRAKKSS